MKLVKFTCGCIGFDNGSVVKPCDGDELYLDPEPSARIPDPKRYTILLELERDKIIRELGSLVRAGYKFRSIKAALED